MRMNGLIVEWYRPDLAQLLTLKCHCLWWWKCGGGRTQMVCAVKHSLRNRHTTPHIVMWMFSKNVQSDGQQIYGSPEMPEFIKSALPWQPLVARKIGYSPTSWRAVAVCCWMVLAKISPKIRMLHNKTLQLLWVPAVCLVAHSLHWRQKLVCSHQLINEQ